MRQTVLLQQAKHTSAWEESAPCWRAVSVLFVSRWKVLFLATLLSNRCSLLKEIFYRHCEILCGWCAVITTGLLHKDAFVSIISKVQVSIPSVFEVCQFLGLLTRVVSWKTLEKLKKKKKGFQRAWICATKQQNALGLQVSEFETKWRQNPKTKNLPSVWPWPSTL